MGHDRLPKGKLSFSFPVDLQLGFRVSKISTTIIFTFIDKRCQVRKGKIGSIAWRVRASAIVRRTPKRTCDYLIIKLTPHRSFAHKSPIFLLDLRALQLIAFTLIKYNYRRPKYPLPGRF
jgi:hypothetical protein